MFVENMIKPVEFSRSAGMSINHQSSELFQDIMRRRLKGKPGFRSSKIEVSGVLIPCHQECEGQTYRFKLGTEEHEYLLSMKQEFVNLAEKASWDEIAVKGTVDGERNVLVVEKMVLKQRADEELVPGGIEDSVFDVGIYLKVIGQRGNLEPAFDELVT